MLLRSGTPAGGTTEDHPSRPSSRRPPVDTEDDAPSDPATQERIAQRRPRCGPRTAPNCARPRGVRPRLTGLNRAVRTTTSPANTRGLGLTCCAIECASPYSTHTRHVRMPRPWSVTAPRGRSARLTAASEIAELTTPHLPADWTDLDKQGGGHRPGAGRRRRAEGRQRPPRDGDVAGPAGLHAVPAGDALRPGGRPVDRPGPVRAVLRALVASPCTSSSTWTASAWSCPTWRRCGPGGR